MSDKNIKMLEHTLAVFQKGAYQKEGKIVQLKLTSKQREECVIYLPDEVYALSCKNLDGRFRSENNLKFTCKNTDSLSMAKEQICKATLPNEPNGYRPLILNFANPLIPGGAVRKGFKAQEEDLCLRSSLLISLESEKAKKYYRYNKVIHSNLGVDAIVLTPNVEVIKNSKGELLEESYLVSVITCAAPMIRYGLEGYNEEEYIQLFYKRICGILKCAAYWNYRELVLGAFGCGGFGNDAKIVSNLFYKAISELDNHGAKLADYFSRIDFAVLDITPNRYNFNEFYRNFGN